jgi:hypothetical protein
VAPRTLRSAASDGQATAIDAQRFVAFHMKSLHEFGIEQVLAWVLQLTVNFAIIALRCRFGTMLQRLR